MPTTEIGRHGRHESDLDETGRRRRDPVARVSIMLGLGALACAFVPAARTYGLAVCALAFGFGLVARRRNRRQGSEMALAGLVLAVFSAVGLVASASAFGSVASHQPSATPSVGPDGLPAAVIPGVIGKDIDIEFGTPHIELEDSGLRSLNVPVKVTNRGDRRTSFDLDFEARDKSGKLITTDNAFVPGLAAGQLAQIRVFNIVNDRLLESLLTAKFAVTGAVAY